MFGDRVAEEDAEDAVLDGVGFVFVESDEDECILHELWVIQERSEEVVQPLTGDGDGCVVSVGGHVWGWSIVRWRSCDGGYEGKGSAY